MEDSIDVNGIINISSDNNNLSNIEKLKNLAKFKKLDLAKINVFEANLFSIKVREVFLKDDSGKKLV